MTFEKALQRLAEKEPKKFDHDGLFGLFHILEGPPYLAVDVKKPTQDDIDRILALIEWAYVPVVHWHGEEFYSAGYFRKDVLSEDYFSIQTTHKTKLEAAKAALIAVVEKEYATEKIV